MQKPTLESEKVNNGIILYGTGIEGVKFYYKYRDSVRIIGTVDRTNRSFHDLSVYSFEELSLQSNNHYIVVAAGEENYKEIRISLETIGLYEYTDFIWTYEFQKRIILIYANCHFIPIIDHMKRQTDIRRNYSIRYYRIGSNEKKTYPSEHELYHCDFFITQDIRENNSKNLPGYKSLICKVNPQRCKVLIVPNLFGCNLFYPQYKKTDAAQNASVLTFKKTKKELTPEQEDTFGGLFAIRDVNIDNFYALGYSVDMIESKLQSKELYSEDEIRGNFEKELNKIKQRERNCSICISDYIEKKYRDIQLFYEPDHPTNALLTELSKRIMSSFGINIDTECNVDDVSLDARELFIYECVREALGLKYKQEYIRKNRSYSTLGNRPLSLREYIEEYICCLE